MANVRYAIVFGIKDAADRFIPQGEFYLRGADIEESKTFFKKIPIPSPEVDGTKVIRLYERYYDKHLEPDINYEKSEYTLETDAGGLNQILDFLLNKN